MSSLHPILAQLSPSSEQSPPVLARGSDVAVTAGAGTGKTRTLVARYLYLVIDDTPLRGVVAITFTKKAAREMRNRVRSEVRRYLERDDLVKEERSQWRDIYARLDAARIGTIHRLCAEILRHHPAEAGIDPRFEMLDEGKIALLQAQAVDVALSEAADDPGLARLFGDFGVSELRKTLADLLKERLEVEEARTTLDHDLWSEWRPYLIGPIRAFVEAPAVVAGFAELLELRANGTLDRAAAANDRLAPDLRQALRHWDAVLEAQKRDDWAAVSRHLAPLRDSLKQKGRKTNWAPASPKTVIAELQDRYDQVVAPLTKDGIDLALDRRLAQKVVPALLRLYDRALAHYDRTKQRQRALDFDDLEALALRLLENHPEIRGYWQGQIRALLVDEFQDTNGRQRDLLEALCDHPGKLFIVGDGKQSIYRFRGADVTVFRQECASIDREGERFELATSYRAHRALLQALNSLLRPVLGEDDSEHPYVAPFAPLRHHREEPAEGLTPPYVELQLAAGSKANGSLERAARALAARLVVLVEEEGISLESEDPDSGERGVRPLDYGDVAILCRASSSFAAYEDALEEAGIPFLTVAGRGFYERPEVRDLLNALQALADPTDDLALVGLLRSFAIGLSDMGLYRLREAQSAEGYPSLWALLTKGDLALLDDEAECAVEARNLIRRLHGMVGRTPVADLLKVFLDATAYRASLLRAGERRAVNNVSKLLADAHASEIVGVSTFLEYVGELRDASPREGEARAITSGAVQIMSVHQAKGLEFPIVAIGDAAHSSSPNRGLLIDEELGLVPPLTAERLVAAADGTHEVQMVGSAVYRLAKARDDDQEEAESNRLIYVAATRAREMLIVNGTVSVYKSGTIGVRGWLKCLDKGLCLKERAPHCDKTGDAVHAFTLDLDGQPVGCVIYESEADLPMATAARCAEAQVALPKDVTMLEPVGDQGYRMDEAVREIDRDPPQRVWRVVPPRVEQSWAPAWVVGQIVHRALAHWLFPDDARRDFYPRAAAEAHSCGLTDERRVRNAVQRAGRMMNRFQASDLYAEMNGAERRLHEVPYSLPDVDGRVDNGVIDVLFHSDGRWKLAEFKTDRVGSYAALDALLEEEDYVSQVGRYLAAAGTLLGERPQPELCFLDLGGRVHRVKDRW